MRAALTKGVTMTTSAPYILAIDQGTSSTRAVIYDHDGRKVIESMKPVPHINNHSGWVEQDPDVIWSSVLSAIAAALIDAQIHPEMIHSIGITNQRETTVVWDRNTGKPIYPAIGWLSQQTNHLADQLRQDGKAGVIREKTGLVIDAYFSATKLRWILDQVPGAQTRAEAGDLLFGTIDTWLMWKLSAGRIHATDYTNASRTMLFNIHTLEWDADILRMLNIPRTMLPKVQPSDAVYGFTENYQFYGVQVPIAGLAGDQQAALVGSMSFTPGMVEGTYGDGAFIMMNTGTQPAKHADRLLTTIAYGMNGTVSYGLEGTIFTAGRALLWLRDELGLIKDVPASRKAANEADPQSNVYLVPAFTGLGAPYWDTKTRGAIFGMTQATGANELVQATLQSIAYRTKDIVDEMETATQLAITQFGADGGSSRNTYLMEFLADILAKPVQRTSDEETTAWGAAVLSGLATGFWKDVDEVQQITTTGRCFTAKMTEPVRQRRLRGWRRAVQAAQSFQPQANHDQKEHE
ncbi:Glycerol kinase [Fructilactobacillus florum 8D]|uniref:ATP:glycerol 3-phosphotransferase n=3 Tax=Fructilactobacillus florum TaxID=640331 RepID=W9EDS8_9LACO|nr:Glycerol kinase [Fructilactobacillus florum 2F]ETO40247.1 Glycerol kinase [Fructilactobacillus florum 8D]KRM90200.1 glycerol kinase [Fructilactobacillus florum DSM 22689 = JCM 16035]